MAGIGEAASVIAVIQISARVFSWCQEYIADVRDASKDVKRLSDGVYALVGVLKRIEGLDSAKLSNLDWLSQPGGQLERCKGHLDELAAKLYQGDGKGEMRRVGLRALKWHFSSKEIEKYLRIIDGHKAMLTLALTADQTAITLSIENRISQIRENKIIAWLSSPDASKNHIAAQEKHEPLTGNWLLTRSDFEYWKVAPNSLLWLHGKAGCGKTILCSTIIDHVKTVCRLSANSVVAYFYFDFNDSAKQKSRSLISSLITQLCCQRPDIPKALEDLYRTCQNGHQSPTMKELTATLSEILGSFGSIYLILDALDECPLDGGERERLLSAIHEIHNWSNERIHMLATSRREVDIERKLVPLLIEQPICIDSALVDEDIKVHVRSQLTASRFSNWPANIKQEVELELTAQANGMFRWAVCQLDILQKCTQPSKIRKALKSLPKTLDATYDRMLLSIDQESQGQALSALKWLAFSARPLQVTELAEAIVVNPQEDPRFDPEDRLFDPSELLHFLPGLVTISSSEGPLEGRNTITLAHFSVKEYLVSERIKVGPANQYFIPEIPANISMAEICIAYLLHFDTPSSLNPQTPEEFPLVRYAAQYWTEHARVAGRDGNILHLLIMELFLSKRDAYVNSLRLFDPCVPWEEPIITESFSKNLKSFSSPLHYASGAGLVESTELLLEKGAEVDAKGRYGMTALHGAASGGHLAVVKVLLEKGAEIDAKNRDGTTAMYEAAYQGHETVVNVLLEKGAEIDVKDRSEATALHYATIFAHEAVVKVLLEKGADVNVKDGFRMTALHRAAYSGYEAIIKMLLEKGAELEAKDIHGRTALYDAAFNGHEAVAKVLLEKGAKIDAGHRDGRTALHFATSNGREAVVKLLLENGAEADAKDREGETALHVAASSGREAVVKLLLEGGAEVDVEDRDGRTALYRATSYRHEAVAKLLLAATQFK